MSLVLMTLQGLALACAGLALALPAYVFVVVLWSVTRTAAGELAQAAADLRSAFGQAWAALGRVRFNRASAGRAEDAALGVTATP